MRIPFMEFERANLITVSLKKQSKHFFWYWNFTALEYWLKRVGHLLELGFLTEILE